MKTSARGSSLDLPACAASAPTARKFGIDLSSVALPRMFFATALIVHGIGLMTALARVGRLFPRNGTVEAVATKVHFDVPPEAVWRGMIFYEEVRARPTPILRLFLPVPVRTRGEKTRVGSIIECTYEGGYLEKRITAAEPARLVEFEILVQQLGVEDCISMTGGSYGIAAQLGGSDVVLTTLYCGHLRPRWLWRLLERFLAHHLHRHILEGMRVSLAEPSGVPDASTLAASRP